MLQTLPDLKLIVDLGVPRNVETEVAHLPGLTVLDIDTLQDAGKLRRETLTGRLAEAETLLQSELELALTNWAERQLGPSIQKLRQQYLQTVQDTLPELSQKEAERLANRFARVPVQGLRAVARTYGFEAAETFLAETDLFPQIAPMNRTSVPVRIATRKSDLALWQANWVKERLGALGHNAELVLIETQGDRTQTDGTPFRLMPGQGFFTKAVQDAVAEGHADVAVHSHKDLPKCADDRARACCCLRTRRSP